jgi:hypothetical protein
LADHFIEWCIQPAGLKGFARGCRLAAFPPSGVVVIKYILDSPHLAGVAGFFPLLLVTYFVFF